MDKNSTKAAQANKKYPAVGQIKKLQTATEKKIVGGIFCRKAGGTQQDF